MTDLQNRITLWQEYEKLKPIRAKHKDLKGKAQKQFYDKHSKEFDRADKLYHHWVDFMKNGNEINTRK